MKARRGTILSILDLSECRVMTLLTDGRHVLLLRNGSGLYGPRDSSTPWCTQRSLAIESTGDSEKNVYSGPATRLALPHCPPLTWKQTLAPPGLTSSCCLGVYLSPGLMWALG